MSDVTVLDVCKRADIALIILERKVKAHAVHSLVDFGEHCFARIGISENGTNLFLDDGIAAAQLADIGLVKFRNTSAMQVLNQAEQQRHNDAEEVKEAHHPAEHSAQAGVSICVLALEDGIVQKAGDHVRENGDPESVDILKKRMMHKDPSFVFISAGV